MIDQPLSRRRGVADGPTRPVRIDRSMDALQYAIACLAIVAAALLAAVR
jgi:hypothetical protein